MAVNRRSAAPQPREVVTRRATTVAIAALFVILGLYPAPNILLQDPAWQSHPLVRELLQEPAFWLAGLLVIVGPAMVLANLLSDRFDAAWRATLARLDRLREPWFMLGAALAAATMAAGVAIYVFSRRPTTSDEVAQLWHARMLLGGRLWLPADPNPEFFAIDNVIDQGRWYSQFPIGGPAALAVAMALQATWLLNPLLAGLVVVNVYRFAARAYGVAEARVAAILCATCPFLLFVSGSYMNHTLVAFLATLALAELPAWADGASARRWRASVVIGLSLGAAIAVRPLDGAVAALVLGGTLLQQAIAKRDLRSLLWALAAGALPVIGLLAGNWLTTGHPLRFGYEVLWGANHSLGFHNSPAGVPHTPARALELAIVYLMQLNWSLLEWPIAGLVVVAGALIAIGRLRRWEVVLIAWIETQLVAYAAYWHAGLFLGPRYLFTVVPALLILVARGLVIMSRGARPVARRSLIAGVGASIASSWLIPSTPFGALGTATAARALRSSFKLDLEPAMTSLHGGKALIFVEETASNRLARRLWSLGISRPDAARLLGEKDHCSLLEAIASERRRSGSPSERLARLERTKNYTPPEGFTLKALDPAFQVSDEQSITATCEAEVMADATNGRPISYGQALLRNEIGPDGHITGRIVFVADIAEHNEALRARFNDRPWYRLYLPQGTATIAPRLVPYR